MNENAPIYLTGVAKGGREGKFSTSLRRKRLPRSQLRPVQLPLSPTHSKHGSFFPENSSQPVEQATPWYHFAGAHGGPKRLLECPTLARIVEHTSKSFSSKGASFTGMAST